MEFSTARSSTVALFHLGFSLLLIVGVSLALSYLAWPPPLLLPLPLTAQCVKCLAILLPPLARMVNSEIGDPGDWRLYFEVSEADSSDHSQVYPSSFNFFHIFGYLNKIFEKFL